MNSALRTGQIPAYEADKAKFAGLNAQVLGISVDHVPCLKAWAENLGGINYPLLSDFWPHGAVAEKYGVLRSEGYTERAILVIDRRGVIRYVDIHDINQQPSNAEVLDVLRKVDPEAAAREPKGPPPAAVTLPRGGIVMYCTPWCPDCKQARAWLKAHGLKYTEVDIYATPGAMAQVRKWGNGDMVTPAFDIDGNIILEFDEQKLAVALKVDL